MPLTNNLKLEINKKLLSRNCKGLLRMCTLNKKHRNRCNNLKYWETMFKHTFPKLHTIQILLPKSGNDNRVLYTPFHPKDDVKLDIYKNVFHLLCFNEVFHIGPIEHPYKLLLYLQPSNYNNIFILDGVVLVSHSCFIYISMLHSEIKILRPYRNLLSRHPNSPLNIVFGSFFKDFTGLGNSRAEVLNRNFTTVLKILLARFSLWALNLT
jgi:hypothetical protein